MCKRHADKITPSQYLRCSAECNSVGICVVCNTVEELFVVPPPDGAARPGSRHRRQCSIPKVKDYKSHQSPNIYPATLWEVGPLNNNVREAPITTTMYRRMYCSTIPYQHPAPRNPAICCAGQPKGTHITTVHPPPPPPPHKGAAVLRRTSTSKRIPIKSRNHQTDCSRTNNWAQL